jgi:hypothetical protein
MRGWIYFLILALAIIALVVYLFNKPVGDVASVDPDVMISSDQLFGEFFEDEEKATLKYRDKVLEVRGNIRDIERSAGKQIIILTTKDDMFGISCDFNPNLKLDFRKGETVKVKGVCAGMLSDVVLTRCSIVKAE